MTPDPPPRLALILGLSTGTLLVLACLTVQVLSRQPPTSAFRIIWIAVGLGGLAILVVNVRLLRARGRRANTN